MFILLCQHRPCEVSSRWLRTVGQIPDLKSLLLDSHAGSHSHAAVRTKTARLQIKERVKMREELRLHSTCTKSQWAIELHGCHASI